jgi:hypothetical protein
VAHPHASTHPSDPELALNRKLDNIGWGLFLVLTGTVWLLPDTQVPPGSWLIGVGSLLLGLNAIRVLSHVPVSGLGLLLGILALAAGLSALWGVQLPLVAIALIVGGVGLLARQVLGRT